MSDLAPIIAALEAQIAKLKYLDGQRPSSPPPANGGMVFPPFGRSKGMPVAGAAMNDLNFYAQACRRTLDDPSKSRFHDKERVLLGAIELEISRQNGGAPSNEPDDVPPPNDGDLPF